MDILGIGPTELVLILIIALIVLGPNEMIKTGKSLGRVLRKVVMSPSWQTVQKTSRELRYLPNRLMREAGIEEAELKKIKEDIQSDLPDLKKLDEETGLKEVDADLKKASRDLHTAQRDLSSWTTSPKSQPAGSDDPEPDTNEPAEPAPAEPAPASTSSVDPDTTA